MERILETIKSNYINIERVSQEIKELSKQYQMVSCVLPHVKTKIQMITVVGLLSIEYLNIQYIIPILIFFPYNYPQLPPDLFVDPSPDMVIIPNHPNALFDKTIQHSSLTNWSPHSFVTNVLVELTKEFSKNPPLRQKHDNLVKIQEEMKKLVEDVQLMNSKNRNSSEENGELIQNQCQQFDGIQQVSQYQIQSDPNYHNTSNNQFNQNIQNIQNVQQVTQFSQNQQMQNIQQISGVSNPQMIQNMSNVQLQQPIQQSYYYPPYPPPNTYYFNAQYPPFYPYPPYQFPQHYNPYQFPYYPPIPMDHQIQQQSQAPLTYPSSPVPTQSYFPNQQYSYPSYHQMYQQNQFNQINSMNQNMSTSQNNQINQKNLNVASSQINKSHKQIQQNNQSNTFNQQNENDLKSVNSIQTHQLSQIDVPFESHNEKNQTTHQMIKNDSHGEMKPKSKTKSKLKDKEKIISTNDLDQLLIENKITLEQYKSMYIELQRKSNK